jgi:hypothetical protein
MKNFVTLAVIAFLALAARVFFLKEWIATRATIAQEFLLM